MLQELLDNILSKSNNIKLGLDNIKKAANLFNLQKPAPYVITIAGTNGKGSVITLLERLLVSLGYQTGCYTSPHLVVFNERIRINQVNITDQELLVTFDYINKILDNNKLNLTFFEFITLCAWQIFSNKNLDIVLLEIGLGGRLDAVNAIPKDLAIITSIDYDHQEYLGDDLESIGYEKAGIITDHKPIIYGDVSMPNIIAEIAQSRNASLYQFGRDYNLGQNNSQLVKLLEPEKIKSLSGIRLNNMATSFKALDLYLESQFNNISNKINIIKKTLEDFNLIGRCSWLNINKRKTILLDVAHNPQAVKNLYDYLINLNLNKNLNTKLKTKLKINAIFGMFKDKDIHQSISIMNPIISHWYLCGTEIEYMANNINNKKIINFNINFNKRGTSSKELANILSKIDPHKAYSCFETIEQCCNEAYNFIEQNKDNDSILVVFGSFHVVGPAYDLYSKRAENLLN